MMQSPLGELLNALAHPYRRELLVALLDHNPQDADDRDPLDTLSSSGGPSTSQIGLVHTHLPKLAELEYIEWDRDANEISKGPQWDEIAPVIELLDTHRDELPDGRL